MPSGFRMKRRFTLHHGALSRRQKVVEFARALKACTKVTINDKMAKNCTLPLIPTKTVRPKQTKKTTNTRTKWRLESVYSRMGANLQRSQWVRVRQQCGIHRRPLPKPATSPGCVWLPSPHLGSGPTLNPGDSPDKTAQVTWVTTTGRVTLWGIRGRLPPFPYGTSQTPLLTARQRAVASGLTEGTFHRTTHTVAEPPLHAPTFSGQRGAQVHRGP